MNRILALAGVISLVASSAFAGGFYRGAADTDIIFEDGKVAARAGVTYVDPNRKFKNNQMPGLRGTEYSDPYWIPSAAAKVNINDDFRCAATFYRPFSADSEYDTMNNRGKLKEKFDVNEYGATCAYFTPVGRGNLFFLGGVFVETFDYEFDGFTKVSPIGFTPLGFDLSSNDFGYRAGIGYEIPEIGFRTQLIYRSGTEHEADGTANLSKLHMSFPSYGQGELPQTVELKVQTGLAPDWLAYGSVVWQDWSQLKTLDINLRGQNFSNYYYWRDGWTISGGVAHKFSDEWSGSVGASWDRGVSTGWDLMGDMAVINATVIHKDKWGGDLRLTGALIWNAPVEETKYAPGANSSAESSWGYGLKVSYKLQF